MIRSALLSLAVCVGSICAAENAPLATAHPAETAFAPETLTNDGVVALANAGFSDSFITEKIRLSDRTRLDVSVQGLSYLRQNAITENLILFILKRSADPVGPSSNPTPPSVVPTVIKAKLKMKKIAVPMEAVSVIFVPSGTAMPANAPVPMLPNSMLPTVMTQPSSYKNPAAAIPGTASSPKTATTTNIAWWQ